MPGMKTLGVLVALLMAVTACGDNHATGPDAPDAFVLPCSDDDLVTSLQAIPGITSVSRESCGPGVLGAAACFVIDFPQPVDHRAPDSPTFTQRLRLAHRSCTAPMVVADWGYASFGFFDNELSALYETNTLWIEHRFQGESIPSSFDWQWTALTIENGATDMHRIVSAFHALYAGRWLVTGASKGGITALYYKYFFPDDVDGAVPYVAPASRERIDPVYQARLDAELPNPCAQRIRDLQIESLTTRRAALVQKIHDELGGGFENYYLEVLAGGLDWGFWQARGLQACSDVPPAAATDDQVWNFIYYVNGSPHPAVDEVMSGSALVYEWLTEQGFALQVGAHVAPLLQDPDAMATMEQRFVQMNPTVPLPPFDGSVTAAVRTWTRDEAEDVVLVYGQFDPWTGGALDEPTRTTSARYFVPGANHSAAITDLPEAERAAALAHVSRMLDQQPTGSLPRARQAASETAARLDAKLRQVTRASSVVVR